VYFIFVGDVGLIFLDLWEIVDLVFRKMCSYNASRKKFKLVNCSISFRFLDISEIQLLPRVSILFGK